MACNDEGSDLCAHAEEKLNLARCCDTGNKSTKTKLMAGASDGSNVVERGEHISTREENRVVRVQFTQFGTNQVLLQVNSKILH